MKQTKIIIGGLVVTLLLTGGNASADTYSKKTFFTPRSVSTNIAMEYATWHDKVFRPHKKGLNSNLQVTGFYQSSLKGSKRGEYFGIGNHSNSFTIRPAASSGNITNTYIMHGAALLDGTVSFSPKQEFWGLRLDYFQDINTPWKKFFFKASLPFVYTKSSVHMKVASSVTDGLGYSISDFFNGKVNVTTASSENLQGPLTKGKIPGRRSETGVADVDLALGKKIVYNDNYQVFFNVGITAPCGNKSRGDFLFEPILGNNKHFGLGFGLDANLNIWKNNKASVDLLAALNHRYLFESTETRIMGGIKSSTLGTLNLGQYYMAGLIGQNKVALFPAANILSMPLRVKPGNVLDGLVNLSFKSGGFIVDFGYNVFYKDDERVWIKSWTDSKYAIVTTGYSTQTELTTATANSYLALDAANFDTDSVKTPSQLTQKLMGALGYGWNLNKKYPTTVGLGASYEMAGDNASQQGYALWIKGGVSF